MSPKSRTRLAEKIMEWGNLVFVGIVITQAFENISLVIGRILLGIAVVITTYFYALKLLEGGEK